MTSYFCKRDNLSFSKPSRQAAERYASNTSEFSARTRRKRLAIDASSQQWSAQRFGMDLKRMKSVRAMQECVQPPEQDLTQTNQIHSDTCGKIQARLSAPSFSYFIHIYYIYRFFTFTRKCTKIVKTHVEQYFFSFYTQVIKSSQIKGIIQMHQTQKSF